MTGLISNNVLRVSPARVVTEVLDSGGAGNTMSDPYGLAVDGAGNVYVSGLRATTCSG
ncbi:MAG: SBBP repeat-containing protein [Ilumatobacteraceae bacterium]